jgi:hypothetical protein
MSFDEFFKPREEPPQPEEPNPITEPEEPAPQPQSQAQPQPKPQPKQEQAQQTQVVINPEELAKSVYMIYGQKGFGKTYLALSFSGTILALSFDYKTTIVKRNCFNNDSRIIVYDPLVKIDYSTPESMIQTSESALQFINNILEMHKNSPPDWILIDGSEIFQKLAEDVMRQRNNIAPFAGVQWTYWKERRFYIRQLHEKAVRLAKKGVIYTAYVDKDEIIVDGQIKSKTDVPRWIDAILYEVDEVIKITTTQDTTGQRRYLATIESSKLRPQKSGKTFDITGAQALKFLEM